MDTSLVRKMEKAKDYAAQEGRVTLMNCEATFRDNNSNHKISCESGEWSCTCYYFNSRAECSHTMATKMMLSDMVREAVSI